MAGHSKWANIRHRKGKADALKNKAFTRFSKEIMTAAKLGGSDPKANPRLKTAIDKAKAVNLPKENIERLLARASQAPTSYDEVLYEIYGAEGVGVLALALTDNKNRTASEVRAMAQRRGGTVASVGAVSHNFEHKGLIFLGEIPSEESLLEALIDFEEVGWELESEGALVTCRPVDLAHVKTRLEAIGAMPKEPELVYMPKLFQEVSIQARQANEALIEGLESLDDIDSVFHSMSEEA